MAGCFATNLIVEAVGDNIQAKLDCLFFATGLRDLSEVTVVISPTQTPAQIKQAITDAILAEATNLGYSVSASNVILPAFQKGA